MKLSQHITMPKLVVGWMLLLMVAAVALPPVGSQPTGALALSLLGLATLLLAFTPIILFRYFKGHWQAAMVARNRATYLAWISVQTLAAVVLVGASLHAALTR